jgi:hypothetical protein
MTMDANSRPDILKDWKAAFQAAEAGELAPYTGEYVAVLRGRVVAHGESEGEVRSAASREHGVHPERLVLFYVDPGAELPLH